MTTVEWEGSFNEDGSVNRDEMVERLMLITASLTKRLGGRVVVPFDELQPKCTAALFIEGDVTTKEVVVTVTTTPEATA
jgi:hypothetical protein